MIVTSFKELWNDFLAHAKTICSPTEFQNWIAPITFVDGDDSLLLEVPNIFVQEYLLENYKKELEKFVSLKQIKFKLAGEVKKEVVQVAEPIQESSIKLNPLYTFDHFIEGPSNQFVKSAAQGVAMRPGKSYNPLFIHGGVGLGKTHLLHAVGHYIREHHKRVRIECLTTEELINTMIDHLKAKSMDKMKRHFRSLDVLLIDDIQFLQGRTNFEDEFCNTFETLIHQSKQVIITSDKPPSELKLSERMTARMEWGLVAQLGMPDLETRVAILQHKAEVRGFKLPQKVAFFIAEHVFNNVRQLEGAVNRLTAYCGLAGQEISEESAMQILGELLRQAPSKRVSVESILMCVAAVFGVRVSDLKGSSRTRDITLPRQVAMYLAKELVGDSLIKLASAFGGKTHSTVVHAWKKIGTEVATDEHLRAQVEMAKKNLTGQ